MSGAVIGLVSLILLLVIGAVIYFSMQEEKKEPVYVAPVVVPVVAAAAEEEEDKDTFDIVNGWIYDNEYNYMIAVGDDNKFVLSDYKEDAPTKSSAKWSFDTDDEFYQISTKLNKYIKITSQDIQLTSSSSSTSRVKIVPTKDGYKFSDKKGKYWMKTFGATLVSVDDESKASVFSIDPSQYYIKGYETTKETFTEDQFVASMSPHDVSCKTGVLSGFTFGGTETKGKYDYSCTEGEVTTGDLGDTILTSAAALTGVDGLATKDSFNVTCESGALAKFRIIPGTGDSASYQYACRDIATFGEPVTKETDGVVYDNNEKREFLTSLKSLQCDDGQALTGFKYIAGDGADGDQNKIKLSGICKKISA